MMTKTTMFKNKIPAILFLASVFSSGAIVYPRETQQPQKPDSLANDSVYLSLVELICGSEPQTPKPQPEPKLNLGALDFLSSVYEESDYYSAGLFDERLRPKNPNTRIYVDGIPDEVMKEFQRPVPGRITSPFGLRENGNRMHKGVDLALHLGDSIRAAISGTVSRVGFEKGGYGNFIVIDRPDGIQSRYAHLQQSLAKPGDIIYPGKIIGLGGSTGNSTGPHLHFEIRCAGTPMDPTPLLMRKVVGKTK